MRFSELKLNGIVFAAGARRWRRSRSWTLLAASHASCRTPSGRTPSPSLTEATPSSGSPLTTRVSPDILLSFLSLLFRGILVYFLLLKESRGRSHYECGLTCFLRSPIMHGSQSYNVLPHHLGVPQGGG